MGVNKVVYGSETLVDLTGDTITAENLRTGYTAHGANGEVITGTLKTAAMKARTLNCGWIGKGDGYWTPESPTESYADMYEVIGGHRYFLTLGENVGTRFRVIFATEDVSLATQKVQCIAVNTTKYDNPSAYQNLTYTPETNGYLVVQKDNAGNIDIKTYLYDTTDGWE